MADYKLSYFDGRGRAEPMRLSFVAAGKKFEDDRIQMGDWPKVKANFPNGQVPCMTYKKAQYGESSAIAAFVAKECGLAGKTNADAMRVSEVYSLQGAILEARAKGMFEQDEAKKAEFNKAFEEDTIPKVLKRAEEIATGGKGFMVAGVLTQADLTVYDFTDTILATNAKALEKYPAVQQVRKTVAENKHVKAYLAARKDTPF